MGEAARLNFALQQNIGFLNAARTLRVGLHVAMLKGEVQKETLSTLFDDFMALAALCQEADSDAK